MIRAILIACLVSSVASAKLTSSAANKAGFCYGYFTASKWCWLVKAGTSTYVMQGEGGYKCKDYNGYSSEKYCKKASVHKAAHHASSRDTGGSASASGNSPWAKYLASLTGKGNLDWQAACKSLGQTPSGYSMGSGGGKSSFYLTCNTNKITVTCFGSPFSKCESAYKPPASSSDTPPPGKYNVKAVKGNCAGMSQKEVQDFLNIHNKMRCAVGQPPVKWNGALQCQAQKSQNSINAFKHSHSYALPISAGENIATGTNVFNAAWMWFTEYLQSTDYEHGGETGHFSAMSWKSVTEIGCGIGRNGKGVVRCQYSGGSKSAAPNFGGGYATNLKKFYGTPAEFKKCGMTAGEVKGRAGLFKKWGILHPTGRMASNIGLYSVTPAAWSTSSPAALFGACAFIGALAMVTIMVAVRRRRSAATQDEELLSVEAADGLE